MGAQLATGSLFEPQHTEHIPTDPVTSRCVKLLIVHSYLWYFFHFILFPMNFATLAKSRPSICSSYSLFSNIESKILKIQTELIILYEKKFAAISSTNRNFGQFFGG